MPHVLVLSGIAGCGKTSLCRFLLYDWRTEEGAVITLDSAMDIVVYIEARNVTCTSLVTFLQKTLLPHTCSHFEEKDILQVLRQVSVLYVIDGMDEATVDAKTLIKDVFSLSGNDKSRLVVTTRPEYQSDVTQLAQQHHLSYMKLTIHGFSDEAMRIFTSRVFTAFIQDERKRHHEEAEFLKFLKTSCTSLAGHLRLPLTLALLVCLWQDNKERMANITSATRLYSEIFRLCTVKMAMRLQSKAVMHSMELQNFVDSWLLALGEEAYRMMEQGRLVIDDKTQSQLSNLCEAKGLPSVQVFSAFLHCDVHTGLLGVHHRFSFVHKSQMEYLAALHVSHKIITAYGCDQSIESTLERLTIFRRSVKKKNPVDLDDIILFSGWGAKWVNTWLFVLGHLCLHEVNESVIKAVVEVIVSVRAVTQNEKTMWRLVEESGRHTLVRDQVGAAMTQRQMVWRPTEQELCDSSNPITMLMLYTSFTPRAVLVRVISCLQGVLVLGEDGRLHTASYENLTNILICLSERPSCQVYLKLDAQYYTWGGKETADHLLQLLQPSGNVVSFTGHLGPEGAAALPSVDGMVELNVRVSKVETLHALVHGILGHDRVLTMTLRLDLPLDSILPASLPTFLYLTTPSPRLHIILNQVDDSTVISATNIINKLSITYRKVDLVTSSLTSDGLQTFIATLNNEGVTVKELTVLSRHHVNHNELNQLRQLLGEDTTLSWWS